MRYKLMSALALSYVFSAAGQAREVSANMDVGSNEKKVLHFISRVLRGQEKLSVKSLQEVFSISLQSGCIEKEELKENRYICRYTPTLSNHQGIYLESYQSFGDSPMPISRGFLALGVDTGKSCISKIQMQNILGITAQLPERPPMVDHFGGNRAESEFYEFKIRPHLFFRVESIAGCAAAMVLNMNIG